MNTKPSSIRRPSRAQALFGGFLATLLGANAQALTIPNTPLESGGQYPPPNVMFILDDSGSMEYYAMPDNVTSRGNLDDNLNDKYAGYNTIYYDPTVGYRPWIQADNTRYTGGTSLGSVYNHPSLLSSSVDLRYDTQTWFHPKTGITTPTNFGQVYRYQIRRVDGSSRVVRSEWLPPLDNGTQRDEIFRRTGLTRDEDWNPRYIRFGPFYIPNGYNELVFETSGGSSSEGSRGVDLYVDDDNWPDGNDECEETGNGNNHTCTVTRNDDWYVMLYARDTFTNVTFTVTAIQRDVDPRTGEEDAGCSTSTDLDDGGYAWRECTFATPTGRSEADEITNYATWYSYHSTRMKVAKAGASEAFAQLGTGFRVGYDSIWNRSPFDIPVGTSDGAFEGSNRTTWFSRMQSANGSGGTPLHGALQRTGEYYQGNSSTGPWGPGGVADQISCRQSFAILTTDGFWNNFNDYSAVGDVDGSQGPLHTSTSGRQLRYEVERPYCDNLWTGNCRGSVGNTVADVAAYFWMNDLRDDLDNNVSTSSSDPAFWQHMVTFGISIGLQGSLDPATDRPSLENGSMGWPDPTNREDEERIDDLWHAAVNGRGAFVAASRPADFQRGLQEAFAIVAQRQGSASNVTANSTSFSTDTLVFQAKYVTGKWVGELEAYDASAAGVADTPTWRASELIPAAGSRRVFTYDGADGAVFPTPAQVTALDQSARANGPVDGAGNVAYLKGVQTGERQNGGELRNRDTRLGDIVNSSPFYATDSDTLFVGANDGMLHAFNATTGVERFAYVPAAVNFGELAQLSDPYYAHRYFVDGPVVVSTQRQTPGYNYLVGSLGRGGKALYGLDVTDPATFDENDVLWELTDADIGYVLGEPLIATLNDVSRSKVAIVANGVNSTSGNAKLLVVNIATGVIMHRIDTGVGGDNGLFDPRGADLDGNGTVDYVYAGDLKGNLWKFDFTGGTPIVALGGTPMFTATDPDGDPQPITSGLALGRDPSSGQVWAFFGTGRFLTADDPSSTQVQTIYGVIDDSVATLTRTDLKEREIIVVDTIDGVRQRGFEPTGSLAPDEEGWYLDLDDPSAGERVVNRPQLRGTVLIFSSRIPPTDNTCDAGGSGFLNAMQAFTGTSTDDPYFDSNGDGTVDEDDTITADDGTTVPVGSIDLGVGMPTLPTVIDELAVVCGSGGECSDINVNPQGAERRRASWREVVVE